MAEIDFSDVCYETRGIFVRGRLKFTETTIQYKNSKTGKVEQISMNDIDYFNWYRFCLNWGIRLHTKQGTLFRFGGFKDVDKEKITKYVKANYDLPMPDKDICVKGWNWGVAKFSGSVLSFEVAHALDFDIPLGQVSQCIAGKNEVTLEFHPNEESPANLMELRFHIPGNELAGDSDPVDAFRDHVLQKADVISAVGDAVAIFREVHCLTPRGRYDIKVYQTFFQLHGKTFDYKIAMSTVLRLFLLPHQDGRQIFFVLSLDPPIKQGQTRYHYLVFVFQQEEELTVELPFTDEEIKNKYDGKLSKEMSGRTFEVVTKLMKVLMNRKLTTPGNFVGHSGTAAIGCSYKAAAGYVYPLERGFIFIHKPPLHIRFEEVNCVNFARSGGSTRSFDFEVELRSGVMYTFNGIGKEEYPKLFDFVTNKKIRIKNSGKNKPTASFADFDDSDAEAEPDAYLARVKAEAEARSDDDDDDEGSEDDADFDPGEIRANSDDDVAEEFDSNASESSDEDADGEPKSSKSTKKVERKKEDKTKKESSSKKSSSNGTDKKESSKEKDKKSEKKSSKDKDQSSDKKNSSSSRKDNTSDKKEDSKGKSRKTTDEKKKRGETSKRSPVKKEPADTSNSGFKSKEFIEDDDDSD